MEKIRNRVVHYFEPDEWKLVEYPKKTKIWKLICLLFFLILNFFFWKTMVALIPVIPYLIMLFIDYQAIVIFLQFKKNDNNLLEDRLRYIIHSNKLYDEEMIEIRENQKIVQRKEITRVIRIWYRQTKSRVFLRIERNGDRFTTKATEINEFITSGIGLEHLETKVSIDFVDMEFLIKKIEQKEIYELQLKSNRLKIPVYGDFNIDLTKNYSMIISGASGAGKSYFTYFYLTSFISQYIMKEDRRKHATIYAIDPKSSDLYKLFLRSGMPIENFGVTNSDAFRIVKNYLAELDRRMDLYVESSKFDSVGIDIGLEPSLLVIEEYSSLVSTMDSKQKKEFEGMVATIAQKSRQLSMGILIVIQSPRSDTLSNTIKEQLNNVCYMGNPSKETAQVLFGTSDTPEVNEKGEGLYSIERNTPKKFKAPIFRKDVFETILPVWEHVAKSYVD